MCYVIVTGRGIFWLLLNLVATMSTLLALLTPKWVIGPMKIKNLENDTIIYTPTVGIYNRFVSLVFTLYLIEIRTQTNIYLCFRCTLINGRNHCGPFSLEGFATDDVVFPAVWKACFFFISLGSYTFTCIDVKILNTSSLALRWSIKELYTIIFNFTQSLANLAADAKLNSCTWSPHPIEDQRLFLFLAHYLYLLIFPCLIFSGQVCPNASNKLSWYIILSVVFSSTKSPRSRHVLFISFFEVSAS